VICSDKNEHQHRVEIRKIDILRLTPPTWQSVLDHEYETWASDPFNLDTALTFPVQQWR
jgi:hypothetical protein